MPVSGSLVAGEDHLDEQQQLGHQVRERRSVAGQDV
jgi:hypothetical protein